MKSLLWRYGRPRLCLCWQQAVSIQRAREWIPPYLFQSAQALIRNSKSRFNISVILEII